MNADLLSPKSLWLLGLLAPLVLLYILKVQRTKLKVASTWLWVQARRDLLARSPFQRFILQLPLILQAIALAALAVAAARPATLGKSLIGDHLAIIIDTSASMSSQDPSSGKTRIELAKEAAHDLVQSLPPGSDAMILDAGRDTRIALPPDRDTRRMHQAIDKIGAREVEGDVAGAIALATNRLQQVGGNRRILVITDGNLARPAPIKSSAIPLELVRVAKPIDNAAIVRVDVRDGEDPAAEREQVQAFLLVGNFGVEKRDLYVTMRQENATDVLASRRVVVEPGEKLPVVLSFYPEPGDYGAPLVFDISPHDFMPVDDVAYGRVPQGRKLPVYLASDREESPWLLRALVSDELAEVRAGTVKELMDQTGVPDDAFVVIDGACPDAAPGGDLLIVDPPGGSCYGTVVGATVESPAITSWEQADVRLRFLTLDDVFVSKAKLLAPDTKRQELIRTDKGTIAADISTSARTITLLSFDVGETSWPLRASFVLFVRNLMEEARRHRSSGMSGPALAGDPLRVSVPAPVEAVKVERPEGGDPLDVKVQGGLAIVPEVERVGLYRVLWEQPRPGQQWVPVNLTSPDESDLTKEPVDTLGPEMSATAPTEGLESHNEWGYVLALAALAFILFDVWWFTRGKKPAPAPARPLRPERSEVEAKKAA
jgi:hypothetical protein